MLHGLKSYLYKTYTKFQLFLYDANYKIEHNFYMCKKQDLAEAVSVFQR